MALFASTNLRFSGGIEVYQNARIPEHLCSGDARESLLKDGLAVEMDVEALKAKPSPAETPPPPVKNWDFKLEDIQEKSLDELNMLIQENVKAKKLAPVKVFNDLEEALLFMSGN